jgi:hypothetical protein
MNFYIFKRGSMSVATTLGPNALGLASMADPTYLGLSTMFGVRPGRGLT